MTNEKLFLFFFFFGYTTLQKFHLHECNRSVSLWAKEPDWRSQRDYTDEKGKKLKLCGAVGGSDCLIGESLWEGLMRDECIRTAEAGRVRQSAKNFACVWVYFGVVGLKGNKNVSQDGAPCGIWNFFQIETRDCVLLKCKHARRNVLCIL